MGEVKLTRDFFLWCMSVIYLFAFSSLYHQLPGLYGDNGILPSRGVIPLESDAATIQKKAAEIPTLLWLAPVFGVDVPLLMDFLALAGIVISFVSMIWGRTRDCANFALLWMLYFSLYQVGQTFMWFQWDILLLETGFLTILVAPMVLLHRPVSSGFLSSLPHRAHDTVTLWLVRWLLFRLMFASGVVKLTSGCPTWWGLTALATHFESQCIPTPLAWFAHHLPAWFLRLGVVVTYVIEIAIPFLFFIPIRSLRIYSFYAQMILQICIILTGNYNFFNFLTMVLCISIIDDDILLSAVGRPSLSSKGSSGAALRWTRYVLGKAIEIIVIGGLVYWSVQLFSLHVLGDWTIDSKIAFTEAQFHSALTKIMPITICIGLLSLIGNILLACYRSLVDNSGTFSKLWSLFGSFFFAAIALWMFGISLVPHTVINRPAHNSLWPILRQWHAHVDKYQLVHPYGLFRRMTGVGGRPEVVIEGSNSLTSGWKEYHFLYKPGDISVKPPFLAPHQPRLDWQMWFASLSSYSNNPWFASLVYRLLKGEKAVLDLLDKDRLPFEPNHPPKYIKATLYQYSFTPLNVSKKKHKANDWWTKKKVGEYFPVADLAQKELIDFLNAADIPVEKTRYLKVTNTFLKKLLMKVRQWVSTLQAPTFIWSLFSAGLTINLLYPLIKL